ncbi:polymorphic toxin type 50 domain-containing protein [Ralstonia syzygii]|uniref:polymorphic toxin type 50 domain-containing protein n=1 Tax=Ralstonia syzygii TaxID=28097 RepID=UPI00399D764F
MDGVHSGAYPIIGTSNRGGYPVVDFGRPIGIDANSGLPTQYGTIHYGQNGAHIVPTNPALTGVKR